MSRIPSSASMTGALWIAEAAGAFETAMIYAALSKLVAALHDPVKVGWLVTVFLLVGAGAAAVAGRLGDMYGRRRVTLILLGAAVAGSLISATATGYPMLVVGRALQGLTGAVLPLTIGLVRENFRIERVAPVIGIMLSGSSAGGAAGLVIGGLIVDHFAWQGIFVTGAIFSAIAFVAIRAFLPPSVAVKLPAPIDWLGGALFLAGIAGVLLVISEGGHWGWLSPGTIATLIAASLALGAWVAQSLRARDPLINIRLFRNRSVLIANIITALAALGTLQIVLVFSLLMQAPVWTGIGLGASATLAGFAKLPSNITSLLGGPLSGWLTARWGGRFTILVGGTLTTVGWLIAMVAHSSIPIVAAILCLISFGSIILFTAGPTILVDAVPQDRTSEAAGVMTVIRQTFLGIGAQLVAVLLATSTMAGPAGGARFPTASAFLLTMAVIIGFGLISMVVALALPARAGARISAAPSG